MHKNDFPRRVGIVAALFAGIILISGLRAQPTEQTVQNRFLFIFDTSRDMKARLEATQKELNTLLATSLSGQMHAGDSMGVWTFGQDLRPGDYPLQTWNPDNAALIASNLVKFVGKQHYAKNTRFETLQPLLDKVVRNSERLTVLIFCDGVTNFSGTPFDAGVNQIIGQKFGEQKKAGQPFIILLRAQLGQYIGCSVGLPPQPLTFPQFPPLPVPPPAPPAPKTANAPPPAPASSVPPLIIIGKKNETSPATTKATATNSPMMTNQPPATAPASPPIVSLPVVSDARMNVAATPATNLAAQTVPQTNIAAPAGVPASLAKNSESSNKGFIAIGAGLLGAAVALGIVFWLRSRQKDPSLITRSMNDRK